MNPFPRQIDGELPVRIALRCNGDAVDRPDPMPQDRFIACLLIVAVCLMFAVACIMHPESLAALAAADPKSDISRFAPEPGGELVGQYLVRFNRISNGPSWTLERLSLAQLEPPSAKRDSVEFKPSKLRSSEWRATNADYADSGYDRGHLAASANYSASQAALTATFSLDNAVPQNPGVNRGKWGDLEEQIRGRIRGDHNIVCVWICTVPIWDIVGSGGVETIGPHRVWVPDQIGKALLIEHAGGRLVMESYLFPNAKVVEWRGVEEYRVSTDKLERVARLDLWAALDDGVESKLEAVGE